MEARTTCQGRGALRRPAEDRVSERSHSSYDPTSHKSEGFFRGNTERTGPEKDKENFGSAMHNVAGLRHGVAVVGSLGKGEEEDGAHNGSCVL